jgi:peptide deformylase
MAIRTIVAVPEKVLRRKARPVTKFGDDLQVLIEDMVDTMRDAPGVGLAAPQVAISEQLIVVEYGDDEDETVPKKLYVMANPVITRMSPEIEVGVEGCLSIPGVVGEVERAVSITVKGQNRHGQPMTVKARGWLARIFQHEIDHINGVLFTDRADKVWKPQEPIEDRV